MIYYIADFNLPNNSAYTQQVLKMCDEFSNHSKLSLLIKNKKNNFDFKILKKKYLLKNKFQIKSIIPIKKKSFLISLIFSFLVSIHLIKNTKPKLVITRVFITSIFLNFFNINHILEIHQELSGFTKFFFNLYYKFSKKNYVKLVFIHKNLINHFKVLKDKKKIVLDDGVDTNDFKLQTKKNKKSCVYTGSLSPGKGFEIIYQLSKLLKDIKFFVYGDKNLLSSKWKSKKLPPNILMKDFIPYNQVPKVLKSHKILLMPYLDKSYGRVKKVNLSNYMSPLKLFDYLAAGRIIVASNLKVYNHILHHKKNSLIIKSQSIKKWANTIKNVTYNYNFYKKIQINAKNTAKNFTWKKRVLKIFQFYEK